MFGLTLGFIRSDIGLHTRCYFRICSDSIDNVLLDTALARGNELLKAKDLAGALAAYTEAIELDGSDGAFRSNRSAVYMSMKEYEKALVDAEVL